MSNKPIIAVDLNGALLESRPFKDADKKWFHIMSVLLDDDSIRQYASLDDYYGKISEVMEEYLGDVSEETKIKFARNLFSMIVIAEAGKKDLVEDFASYLKKLKDNYKLALITSAPEASVEPVLYKIGCQNLFDILYKSPMGRYPDKKSLFKQFIEDYGKPKYYIGNGDNAIKDCKEMGIKTISVNWVSQGEIKGDYDIQNVSELENILKLS